MIAFLDIETSWQGAITVVGVYRPRRGTQQLVGEAISSDRVTDLLRGVTQIFTYNGSRFDLPMIRRHTALDLLRRYRHRDLMFDCWAQGLYGGLKVVERTLGIHRDTDGLTGIDAMNLWERSRRGDHEALDLLLRYNREDIENLEVLAWKLNVLRRPRRGTLAFAPGRLDVPSAASGWAPTPRPRSARPRQTVGAQTTPSAADARRQSLQPDPSLGLLHLQRDPLK